MMGFDLMEICSMEVTLFCVFVCKGDLVHAAKESFQRTGRECLVSGLEAYHLKCQEAGIALWRVHCKTDLVFLDRGSLVLSSHLFLVISLTPKLIYFPSHLYLGYASACCRGVFSPDEWVCCTFP